MDTPWTRRLPNAKGVIGVTVKNAFCPAVRIRAENPTRALRAKGKRDGGKAPNRKRGRWIRALWWMAQRNRALFFVSAAFQSGSNTHAVRSELVLETGATAHVAGSEWLIEGSEIWRGRTICHVDPSRIQHAADVPTVLADQVRVLATFLEAQNIPALMSKGTLDSMWGDIWTSERKSCIPKKL